MEQETEQVLSRRSFARQTVESILAFSLLDTLLRSDVLAAEIKPKTAGWLTDINELGREVKSDKLKQAEWQKRLEQLLKDVDLPELLKFVDFEQLEKEAKAPDNGAQSLRFKFQEAVPKFVYGKQIFALKKGRSVVPHGHDRMATAFVILKGEFHGRHYDRVEDEKEHIIIKPTIDRKFTVGGFSTVTDYKDNVHWFKALKEPAYIFNIHVTGLNAGSKKRTGRVYLDPNGEKIKDGLIRARRIGYKESHELYG